MNPTQNAQFDYTEIPAQHYKVLYQQVGSLSGWRCARSHIFTTGETL